jgi:hypothetical protein
LRAISFVVGQELDASGHVLAVRDPATQDAYWRLTDVDEAGRFRTEQFGNDVLTERSCYSDKQRLERFVTRGATGTVQDLTYDYDDRLDLGRSTDALQSSHRTERFRHDPLHRLTCAYLSPVESASIPCASSYGVAPDGNLTFKSDVGTLAYDDPPGRIATDASSGGSRLRMAIKELAHKVPQKAHLPGAITTVFSRRLTLAACASPRRRLGQGTTSARARLRGAAFVGGRREIRRPCRPAEANLRADGFTAKRTCRA